MGWHERQPRPAWGLVGGGTTTVAVAAALLPLRDQAGRATPALLLVLPVVLAGVLGGVAPAAVIALVAAAAFDLAFIPPYWTPKIAELDDLTALVVFLVIAVVVGVLVAREADRRQTAERRARDLQGVNDELRALEADRARLAEETNRVAVLTRVDEQRSALLRSVSHDLRTPLAGIQAAASELRSGATHDAATAADLLDLIGEEAERLDRLVANLLSLSRIEAGALRPDRQAVDLGELVEHCVKRLGRLFTDVRLTTAIAADLPLVDADYNLLDQVLSNLLENAARHVPVNSPVTVSARQLGGSVEVAVQDAGQGVLHFERELIFEPFRRSVGSASSGIGLAICRAIVEAHHGTIGVDDAPGGGARFAFTIPVRRD